MKVLISINTSWNIYNFRLGLIKSIQNQGHSVYALAPKDEYVDLIEREGVQCYFINLDSQGTNVINDLKLIYSYYLIFKKLKPDIILSYTIKPNIYGNFAAKFLGIPVINNVSGLGTLFIKRNFSTIIGYGLYKLAFFKSNWIFFQNPEDQLIFLNKNLITTKLSSVIPGSGVNLNKFKFNRERNIGKNILFVGRLIGDKGIYEFIESAKILNVNFPDLIFQIVGELGYENKTAIEEKQLLEWLKLPFVYYLGKVDNMKPIYEASDIMVLPSYREGLSKSLIEACAMSLPVVTTDVPGCRDVVLDRYNGLLCVPRDSYDLADKISIMVRFSESERLIMGKNSRKIASEKFDEQIVIQSYLSKINDLVG